MEILLNLTEFIEAVPMFYDIFNEKLDVMLNKIEKSKEKFIQNLKDEENRKVNERKDEVLSYINN